MLTCRQLEEGLLTLLRTAKTDGWSVVDVIGPAITKAFTAARDSKEGSASATVTRGEECCSPLTLNPQPSTLNPQPSTLNPHPRPRPHPHPSPSPSTLNPQPSTLNPHRSPMITLTPITLTLTPSP